MSLKNLFSPKRETTEEPLNPYEREEKRIDRLGVVVKALMDEGEQEALNKLLDKHLPAEELLVVWKRISTVKQAAELFRVPEEMVALQAARHFNQMIP